MSTGTIFHFAIGVFGVMLIGIVLTGLEFRKLAKTNQDRNGAGTRSS